MLSEVLATKEDSSRTRRIKALRAVSKDPEVQTLLKEIDRYLSRIMLHSTSRTPWVVLQFASVQPVLLNAANRDLNFVDWPEILEGLHTNLSIFGRAT